MSDFPDTRDSLLLRVRDGCDVDAWQQFVAIYRPLIYRLARQRGLQDADAQDLAQRVLLSVSRAIDRWEPDGARARFRTWLTTVARNAILNALSRERPDQPVGGDDDLLAEHAEADPRAVESLEFERRREVFRWAARQVRSEFSEATWSAFWLTTVENESIEDAAAALDKTVGAVYAARSRVMRRLREQVEEYDPR